MTSKRGVPDWSVFVVVALFASGCYLNSLTGDFVHDDLVAVVGNPDVVGRNPVAALFENDFWGRPMAHPASHKSYRPLTVLTFRDVVICDAVKEVCLD
ncbi:uncharacterized protein CDAR_172271 [Caerostris darwini]|uniref:Uncharacterized protein n=1 Tax=Caerostris darwini TaxID=1538125 RepID=A0AAV4U3C9_9ARAC|nr:uncharacterized protein CDAR_172271 [Caerostris darwini]